SRSGMGVLLATHELDQAEALCSNIGLLQAAKLVLQGKPQQLIQDAYGGQKEVIVELQQAPSRSQIDLLQEAGFSPQDRTTSWVMLSGGVYADLERMAQVLRAAGLELKEIRLREPDLQSLFLRVVRGGKPVH